MKKNSAHNNLLLTRVITPMDDGLAIELCKCGYHVYSDIWEATAGEELLCGGGSEKQSLPATNHEEILYVS